MQHKYTHSKFCYIHSLTQKQTMKKPHIQADPSYLHLSDGKIPHQCLHFSFVYINLKPQKTIIHFSSVYHRIASLFHPIIKQKKSACFHFSVRNPSNPRAAVNLFVLLDDRCHSNALLLSSRICLDQIWSLSVRFFCITNRCGNLHWKKIPSVIESRYSSPTKLPAPLALSLSQFKTKNNRRTE